MNKMTKLVSARALLVALFMAIVLPFIGSIQTSALKLDDLAMNYVDTGNGFEVQYGQNSAWSDKNNQASAWTKIFTKYKGVIMGISGIATLTMVVLFILNFMKLGQSAGNPQARSQALTGLLWTGIAAAGAGGVTVFVGVFSSMLAD